MQPSPEELALIAATRGLAPAFRERAEEIDRTCRLPEDLVRAMSAAGVFRMYVPGELGGLDVHPTTLMEVVMAFAAADGSAGWNAAICAAQGVYLSRLAPEEAGQVVASGTNGIAGAFNPVPGRAERSEGGYRVSGHWRFASGSAQSTWMMAPAMLYEGGAPVRTESGAARSIVAIVPKSSVTVLDNWNPSGLRGTSSQDFTADNLEVADTFVFRPTDPGRYAAPLNRLPIMTAFGPGLASTCIGIARGAVDDLVALATEKRPAMGGILRDRPAVQLAVAEAEACVSSARALLAEAISNIYDCAVRGQPPAIADRARQRIAAWNAARSSLRAVQLMSDCAGSSLSDAGNRLDRASRDIRQAVQHVALSQDAQAAAGKALLGLDAGQLV